jgi:hypothetical protein
MNWTTLEPSGVSTGVSQREVPEFESEFAEIDENRVN